VGTPEETWGKFGFGSSSNPGRLNNVPDACSLARVGVAFANQIDGVAWHFQMPRTRSGRLTMLRLNRILPALGLRDNCQATHVRRCRGW
jgi:hypothetical protein